MGRSRYCERGDPEGRCSTYVEQSSYIPNKSCEHPKSKPMNTLTETAFWSRQVIKYGIAFLVFLILARIAWQVGFAVYRYFFPEPPPKPTVLFGKLQKLNLPSQEGIPKFSYTLELPEGNLPVAPLSLSVFAQTPPRSSLVALDQARLIANKLDFTQSEESLSESIYRWRREDAPATLEMNIINGTFSVSYDLISDPSPLDFKPPTAEVAASEIKGFLSSAGIWPEDFTQGQINSLFLKNSGGQLVPALSLSDASFVRIDFLRQKFNELPVVTPKFKNGNVWFLVSGANVSDKKIIAGEYHYFSVDKEGLSTYPIKTSQAAWDELNQGQGFIINAGNNKDRVVIRRVYIAYYDSNQAQQFFQPVYVFEGDNEFVAYVPAVTTDYYGQ